MAEAADKGGGSGGSPGGFFDVLGAVGAAQAAVGDIVTELESFTKFQQRVDQLIKDLKGSDAGPTKVGEEMVMRAQFGGGGHEWPAATNLYSKYHSVVTQLESLSKLLSDSIEAMGIAVMASHKGYGHIDMDIRERMAAIAAEAKDHYGGDYNPQKEKEEQDRQQAAHGGSKGSDGSDGASKPEQKNSNGGSTGGNY
ncbi:hypothetical protein ACFWVU_38470 [Streptomyces sp. NPDC058686]|uniref:hypothetical protein n=1 Tax=Streptomyces sp. NPDC058686 TaxID=3346599 RepID=UPI00365D4F49